MATDGQASKRKSPEDVAGDSIYLNFSIKAQDGRQMFFKVNRDTELIKVFKDYCGRRNLEYKTLRFLYNGHRVVMRQTPNKLNMENGDEILAMSPLTGGGCGI